MSDLTPAELTVLANVTLSAAEFAWDAARAARVPHPTGTVALDVTSAMWRKRAVTLTILSGKLLDMSRTG